MFRGKSSWLTLAFAFGPYLMFDILFQETATTRYALPAVVPVAYLAAAGLDRLRRRAALGVTIALALAAATIGELALSGYSREEAPAFRMLAEWLGIDAPDKPAAAGAVLSDPTGRFRAHIVDAGHYFPLKQPQALAGVLHP